LLINQLAPHIGYIGRKSKDKNKNHEAKTIDNNLHATTPEPNFIREKRDRQDVMSQPPEENQQKHPKSLVDEAQNLDDKQKEEVNKRLLQSGGILRDYDNNEVLYPMNLAVLSVLENMLKEAKSAL
jgi:hypothetical protein